MKRWWLVLAVPAVTACARLGPAMQAAGAALTQGNSPGTVTAFYVRETTTGMTKQCVYNALGSTYVRTMSAVTLCPLSIVVTP